MSGSVLRDDNNKVCVIMQKLQIVFGISAILAAITILLLYPRIKSQQYVRSKQGVLLLAAVVYVVIWFVLCYVVAIGMFLVGMW